MLGSTSELLLPARSLLTAQILVSLVYVVPVLGAGALAWFRPGRLAFVVAAVLPGIPLAPLLVGQIRPDLFWLGLVAVAEILLSAAIVTPLMCLLRFPSPTR